MERKIFLTHVLTVASFLLIGLYVLCNIMLMQGQIRERKDKVCVSPEEMEMLQGTLEVANTICVDSKEYFTNNITTAYESQISKLEKEEKYWKDSYFWLKKTCPTE